MADTKFSDIHTQATGNTEHHGYDGNTTFDYPKPDWTWIDPYTVIPIYPYYPSYPSYPITISYPDRRKTGIVIEGEIEDLIPLLKGVKERVRITIEGIEEEN